MPSGTSRCAAQGAVAEPGGGGIGTSRSAAGQVAETAEVGGVHRSGSSQTANPDVAGRSTAAAVLGTGGAGVGSSQTANPDVAGRSTAATVLGTGGAFVGAGGAFARMTPTGGSSQLPHGGVFANTGAESQAPQEKRRGPKK